MQTRKIPSFLYARREHGGHRVQVLNVEGVLFYDVEWPDGSVRYDSARKLVRALYNEGDIGEGSRDPGVSFDRYFKLGKWAPEEEVFDNSFWDLLGIPQTAVPRVERPIKPNTSRKKKRKKMEVVVTPITLDLFSLLGLLEEDVEEIEPIKVSEIPSASKQVKALHTGLTKDAEGHPLGIDLAKRGEEVRKLLYAGFGRRMKSRGYDFEDVLQTVYQGILVRNAGKCPWDSRKSTFGHYVHMVCSCVLSNYHRKKSRLWSLEQVGVSGYSSTGEWKTMDVSEVASMIIDNKADGPDASLGFEWAMESLEESLDLNRPDGQLASKILPYVVKGYQRSEIAQVLDLEVTKVGRALSYLRRQAREWGPQESVVED